MADEMSTDTAAQATRATSPRTRPEVHAAHLKGYRQPVVDVAALTALLDGTYAEVRDLVRATSSSTPQILATQETLTRDDFRERVKDVVVEMAATGQTGMGFPEEYGGGGDIGASIAAFETLALRRPVGAGEGGRAVRPVRRRDPAARHEAPPRRLPRRPRHRPS